MPAERDVIVVGGGAIGCAIAWQLALRGLPVTVIERGVPGAAATGAAAGMLSPLGELRHSPPLAALGRLSLEAWPAFAERLRDCTGMDVAFAPTGTLHVSLSETDDAALDDVADTGRAAGVQVMTGAEARALEPALSPAVRHAVLVHGDASVDNRRLGHALWHAAERSGVQYRIGTRVMRILSDASGARVRGVRLDDGTSLASNHVVIAAGAWSTEIEGLPRHTTIFPVRGEMLSVGPATSSTASGAPSDGAPGKGGRALLTHMLHAPGGYLVPRARGQVLVGATVDAVGFAPGPTVAGIARMLAMACAVVPAIAELPITETWAGYRPAAPDHLPVLGSDPTMAGLFWATGHFRNGILLAPITGERIAALVAGESVADLGPFSPARFG